MVLLINFIDLLFWVLNLAILARVVLSWFNVSPFNPFVRIIYQVTDPIFAPLRRIIPPVGMLDLTPWAAVLLLWIIQQVVVRVLMGLVH
jgi:YggT family protein